MDVNTSSDDTSSSLQRLAVSPPLTPTDTSTLKQLWLQESTTEFTFNEYHLNRIPESLKTFVDLFLLENERYKHDKDRFIWTSNNSFVRVGSNRHDDLPGVYRNNRFALRLTSGDDLSLYIHSTTLEDAMACLELLVGLHDDHFEQMELAYHNISDEDEEDGPPIFPLTCRLLATVLLQNAKRKNSFDSITFTPDQSRTLATSGTRTDIELHRCLFQDDGAAFLEALTAREDPEAGLTELSIAGCLPFADGILVLLLDRCEIESLTLIGIYLENEEACRAVAEAELQYLGLRWSELADGGASLVESVRVGRGPKALGLGKSDDEDDYDWSLFDSSERFVSLLNALRGNSHLERLVLSCFDFREEGVLDALAAGLFENKGLVHLDLEKCHLDERGFCEFLRAISTHPSLRTLDLTCRDLDMDKTAATKAVAEMLSVNKQLEGIIFHDEDDDDDKDDDEDSPFDSLAWVKLVTPRLECNVYRKRFPAIQNIRSPSTRAAVVARALSHANDKPSPVFMLLRQNVDILASSHV
jgi:hypothetical protein